MNALTLKQVTKHGEEHHSRVIVEEMQHHARPISSISGTTAMKRCREPEHAAWSCPLQRPEHLAHVMAALLRSPIMSESPIEHLWKGFGLDPELESQLPNQSDECSFNVEPGDHQHAGGGQRSSAIGRQHAAAAAVGSPPAAEGHGRELAGLLHWYRCASPALLFVCTSSRSPVLTVILVIIATLARAPCLSPSLARLNATRMPRLSSAACSRVMRQLCVAAS